MTDVTLEKTVRKALQTAFQLGQVYWQQADSESVPQWKKSDATKARFADLVQETCAIVQQGETE